jgi:hypothetical protein
MRCAHMGQFAHYDPVELEQPCPHSYRCPVCLYYSGCETCDPHRQRYQTGMTDWLKAELEAIVAEHLEKHD